MRMRFSAQRHQSIRGFTLTELAIVMGIIGLILGAVWVAAGQMSKSSKIQTAQQQVAFIVNNYKTLFSARGVDVATGTDITCNSAAGGINGVSDNFFPAQTIATACVAGNTAKYPINPWQGYYQATADAAGAGGIMLTLSSLPQDACIRFATDFPNTGDIISIKINAVTFSTLPVTVAQASGQCVAGTNLITIDYKAR